MLLLYINTKNANNNNINTILLLYYYIEITKYIILIVIFYLRYIYIYTIGDKNTNFKKRTISHFHYKS